MRTRLPLPRGWKRRVRSSVVHVLAAVPLHVRRWATAAQVDMTYNIGRRPYLACSRESTFNHLYAASPDSSFAVWMVYTPAWAIRSAPDNLCYPINCPNNICSDRRLRESKCKNEKTRKHDLFWLTLWTGPLSCSSWRSMRLSLEDSHDSSTSIKSLSLNSMHCAS